MDLKKEAVEISGDQPSEAVHIGAATSRSQLGRVLTANLWYRRHRMEKTRFVSFARYYLGLPPLTYQPQRSGATCH